MRAQVRWSIAVLGTGFLAVMLLAQWSGARAQNHMKVASTSLLPATLASQEAVSSFQRCVSTYSEAVIMDDKNSLVRADEAAQAVQAALQAVHKSLASTPEKQNQVGSLISDFDELRSRSKTTYSQMIESKGSFTPELQAAAAYLAEQNRHMEESLRQLRTTLSASLQGRMDTVYSSSTTERIFGLALFLVLALGGMAFTVMVERRVSGPLEQLITRCKEIAGDLTGADQEITAGDEITELAHSFDSLTSHLKAMAAISDRIAGGDLAQEVHARSEHDALGHALARMTEGLGGLVLGVRRSATEVAACAGDVARASEESARISSQSSNAIDEVTSTMHEMTVNVQNVVKHTQVQSAKVSETSASIHQMVTSIQRVADSSGALLQLSDRSRAEVQGGIERMQKATDGLNHINRSIQASSAIIDALGRRAESIGKIVDVIDDMAEQTNLLALNAAIEAARAGEHGLGFAVVADEVRKLAEKSAQSTREISELILSIQKEAQNAVANMNKSAGIVNEGLVLGAELENALKQIAKVVTEVHQFAREIGGATAEQSNGSTQIAQATERLNGITHEINCSVEEQAAGTQAIVKAMESMRSLVQRSTTGNTQVAASAEQMSKMSRILLELIDRFKLEWRSDSDEDSRRAPRRAKGPGMTNNRSVYAREGQRALHTPQLAKNRAH